MTYAELDAKLQGRCKTRRKLANNTWAHRSYIFSSDKSAIFLLYHNTNILRFDPNGDIIVNVGHWFTVTTKQRLNRYLPLPYGVWSQKGVWMVCGHNGPVAVFNNGMVIHPDGTISNAQSFIEWQHEQDNIKRMNRAMAAEKRVRCYVHANGRFCNLYINHRGECKRHGFLPLPGHDEES